MSKKGMEFNIVVVLALAVFVLLLVGVFYTGGFKSLTGKTTSFVAKSLANSSDSGRIAQCNMLCTAIIGPQAEDIRRFQTSGCSEIVTCDNLDQYVECESEFC